MLGLDINKATAVEMLFTVSVELLIDLLKVAVQ